MASTREILSRFDKVRPAGKNQWLAPCPAHQDKSPSLSIKETEQGNTLVHCFAGCTPRDVVGAIGLGLNDLFLEQRQGERPFYSSADLEIFEIDSFYIAQAKAHLKAGKKLLPEDQLSLQRKLKRACEVMPELLKNNNTKQLKMLQAAIRS